MPHSLTRAQIRGARAMLGWSIVDLAKAAHLSVMTIKRAEDDRLTAPGDDMLMLIEAALTGAGTRFLADDGSGPGLRLKRQSITEQ